MRIGKILVLVLSLAVICGWGEAYAFEAAAKYSKAVKYIKAKQPDFAFMEFRGIARDFPKSRFAQKSRFAIAEYYYDRGMRYDAVANFKQYINDYPGSKAVVFAKAYLLKIMEEVENPSLEEKEIFESVRKDFFSRPLFLLFAEYKETSYKSASCNKFEIRYYIDNIEVYRNGSLFVKITP
ncbi:MAG: outer membrane protein assembly factor BamD [Candidatus Omnitrophota bacterium]|jgi:outer membrane protein assembly factor BamD (BamD/ComL family)